ncbi:hypothetical protein T4E_10445 [Trichinella pseudospiralis]|uniref:Uncharacterized protein n=1 Tax=Trichinella pseudospiralis TaxID=6337 RepID=A0A0V0YN08_TRIPS|nr:hypothetical protein T4E_10445 [Trichinella pseudospiralis]
MWNLKIRRPNRRAAVAEWLRRLTRNQLGSARTGSNPVCCEFIFIKKLLFRFRLMQQQTSD